MSALVEIKDVCKIYNPGENEVRALDHVSLTIDEQEFVAIIGHSGSGKSTLMNMLGCLDVPTSGNIGCMDRTCPHYLTMNCPTSGTGRSGLSFRVLI